MSSRVHLKTESNENLGGTGMLQMLVVVSDQIAAIDILLPIKHAACMLIRLISVSTCYSNVNSGGYF